MPEVTNRQEPRGVVMSRTSPIRCFGLASALAAAFFATAASAIPLFPFGQQMSFPQAATTPRDSYDGIDQSDRFRRQVGEYPTREAARTLLADTPPTHLYDCLD